MDLTEVSSDRVIVDADRAFPAHGMQGKRCDFVLFLSCEDGRVLAAPIELKGGNWLKSTQVTEQLQGGAKFVDRLAPKDPKTICRPILFHSHPIGKQQRPNLNRAKITFRGLALTIKTARCGRSRNLAEALKE